MIPDEKIIEIISFFKHFRIKMNLMQNSAWNVSACFDKSRDTEKLFEVLSKDFFVRYNEDVKLVTIRNYSPAAIAEMTEGKTIINSQITRKMAMFVLK
jgi:aspartate kinase